MKAKIVFLLSFILFAGFPLEFNAAQRGPDSGENIPLLDKSTEKEKKELRN